MLAPTEALLLDRLTFGGAVSALPTAAGIRRARGRGAGVEFHEYRRYQAGDDPRTIDWTVEARLRQLVVRVSRADGHLRLHVLVDTSGSMSAGTPTKLACAQRVAAALCYVALERRDAAGVSAFRDRVDPVMPPAPGKAQLLKALEQYAAASRGPGLIAVLSDYFEPGAGITGLQSVLHRRLTPAVIQVLAREELAPEIDAHTELVDIEQPDGGTIVIDAAAVSGYRRRLGDQEAALKAFCASQGLPWARIVSDMSFSQVLAALEDSGLLGMRV
jgi:uncharacterized protein (DUF58 family)